ncbi:MAG: tRNA dihydrouridine synthase DusB [Candidatus Cryosericum sp.]|nr:tRNA dihydrouridine synthase DusB [Candidatus Cryosericum sp.]HPS69411.1 tRNA dihydrouridine synthase DusB [Candidatus Cryosericum sp.]
MRIGSLQLDGRAILAPLAGYGDSPFRVLCRRYGAAMVYTEMVSSLGIRFGNAKTMEMLAFDPAERPVDFQLFGARPDAMAQAASVLTEAGVDAVDINMGCPEPKIVKTGAGSALLKDLALVDAITAAVVRATSLPVTVKIRKGFQIDDNVVEDILGICEKNGVAALAIHGSTAVQGRSGAKDWDVIASAKEHAAIPVIANGGVKTAQDAQRFLAYTKCDYVMIGRAALGNPWVFEQINDILGGARPREIGIDERFSVMQQHVDLEIALKGETIGVKEMRKHLSFYFKGLPEATTYRGRINQITGAAELKGLLDEYHNICVNAGEEVCHEER